MKRTILTLGLLLALLGGALSPSPTGTARAAPHQHAPPAIFDKTRFALHLGLAYFAFHHFVYSRWKDGSFKPGAAHRTLNIVKAGVALLFTYHELKKAYDIAHGSSSGVLRALVKPLDALVTKANAVANRLRGGQYSDAEVSGLVNASNSFSQQATHNGISIKDIKVFVPGQ
jgi:hypothetical protein